MSDTFSAMRAAQDEARALRARVAEFEKGAMEDADALILLARRANAFQDALRAAAEALDKATRAMASRAVEPVESVDADHSEDWALGEALAARDAARAALGEKK